MLTWLLAALPIIIVLIVMIGLRWSAARAGALGWLTALVIAGLRFGAGGQLLTLAFGKSLLLSAYVLYIIWMALLFFQVVNEAGVIAAIGAGLPALTADRGLQVLLIGWAFGSFLQGVAGYGVPTAIVAPLLVGLGFAPVAAVVIAGTGHAWKVIVGCSTVAAAGREGAVLKATLMYGLAILVVVGIATLILAS